MDDTDIWRQIVQTFRALKYVFNTDISQGESVPRLSTGKQIMIRAATTAALGLGAGLGTSYPQFSDTEVKHEVNSLNEICDLVSVRLDTGGTLLALFIDATELTDETILGRSVLIKERIKNFGKFTMKMGWAKRGVIADVFYVFQNSEPAFRFRNSTQDQCKYSHLLFPKLYALPWGIDVSAKSVWGYKGWPPPGYMSGLEKSEIENRLFA